MFNNNIYDTIKGHIFSFEVMYGHKPNVIKIGRGNYNRLCKFISDNKLDSNLLVEIEGCTIEIKESFDDFLVVDRVKDNIDIMPKQIDKNKEKVIKWLMNGEGLGKSKISSMENSQQIDKDLELLHNEFEFEKWLKKNNRL